MKSLAVILVALLAPGLLHAGNFPVADLVLIEKGARKLHLLQGGEIFKTFEIALGIVPPLPLVLPRGWASHRAD